MMEAKLSFSDKPLSFDDFNLMTLVIENRKLLFRYLRYLHDDFRGNERYWSFSKDMEGVPIDSVAEFVPDFFALEINSKKNINALYKLLKKTYYDRLHPDIDALRSEALSIVKEIALDFELELSITNEIQEDDLFKIMDLRFSGEELSEKERFIKYCHTLFELRGISVFFVVSAHLFFSSEELSEIIDELKYRRIKLFDLEFANPISAIDGEIVTIIDSDLCLIA